MPTIHVLIWRSSIVGAQIIPPGVHLANITLAEGTAASVQPATSPVAGAEPSKGTEFFMSSINFIGCLSPKFNCVEKPAVYQIASDLHGHVNCLDVQTGVESL